MGQEVIRGVLKNLGLTEKEAEVYIFLSKHGVLKCNDIAKGMKRHKAQIYRILKILETKGLLESTLEAPARFTSVPFETVLDLSIRAKRDEAARMEKARNEILTYWRSISQPELEPPVGKFVVVEGNSKIYPKVAQMISETKSELSVVVTVPGLARASQYGIFDSIFTHPLKSKINIRFITDLSSQNLNTLKRILSELHYSDLNLKGRKPELGLQSPRMVIKDKQEILFFITPNPNRTTAPEDVCLWTNCKELALAFSAVFEELWRNSTDIEEKMAEIESGNTAERFFINNGGEAEKYYNEIINSAKKQIVFLTSAKQLIALGENKALRKAWNTKGISLSIMAPITSENLKAALQLSKTCVVRHVPSGYLSTALVDDSQLFQFGSQPNGEEIDGPAKYENAFYTNDCEHVERIRLMMANLWEGASFPSSIKLDSLMSPRPEIGNPQAVSAFSKVLQNTRLEDLPKSRSTVGQVLIHPPSYLGIPALRIHAFHYRKESAYGRGNTLYITMRIKTEKGYGFVPAAVVETNEKAVIPLKAIFLGTPASDNFKFVKPDELQMREFGNTMFVGWTMKIPVPCGPRFLPPACMLFEAYGKGQHVTKFDPFANNYAMKWECDDYDAFVTFLDPAWKYSAPGTEAVLSMNAFGIMTRIE